MRVLIPVLHYYPVIGGLENWTQNIAELLSAKAEIFVVTGKVKNESSMEIKNGVHSVKSREAGIPQNAELFNGVKIFRTSLFSLTNLSYSSLLYILTALPYIFFKAFQIIKREKINILHCQGFLSSLLGYLLFQLTKIPYIVTVQRLEGKNWVKKLVYKDAKFCIAASSAIKNYFQEIGCKKVEVIPNGIDLKKFENLKHPPHDKFTIITVARLEKVKGINYLIEAVNILSSKFQVPPKESLWLPTEQASSKLLIIGDGSERKNLENLVEKLNLKEKVKFLGEIPNEKIPEYLVAGDCFVLPSVKEGFGIVILEAMACQIPVVGTNVGGISDIIEDGKTGILVEPKKPEQIASALFKIYSEPKFRETLVDSAVAELTRYDWDKIAEKVYEIYIRHRHISS